MAFANYFHHSQTKKYMAVFGSLFNEITIERDDEGVVEKKFIVPIAYGPWQKFLSKKLQTPEITNAVAVRFPRMAFEITGMTYDGSRKRSSTLKMPISGGSFVYTPIPYNLDVTLTIVAKYLNDIHKILEQIIPFFGPDYIPTVQILENGPAVDTPISLTGVAVDDQYEGDYETRRAITATLSFNMKVMYFGPVANKKIIKFVDIDLMNPITGIEMIVSDKNDPDKHYTEVNIEDDWEILTEIKESS